MATFPLANGDQGAPHASLVCSVCGYGIARATPPGPCPMCRADDAWAPLSRRGSAAQERAEHLEWMREVW